MHEPADAAERRKRPPVVVYPTAALPRADMAMLKRVRRDLTRIAEVIVPPREGRCFEVPAGHFFRIVSIDGPQVGDLNLWNAADLTERFYSGKTRALHATHVSTGDRLWSTLPHLRPMATISADTLGWYGWDEDGAGVHDVIGTRCDPYTNRLLAGQDYHHCCHSNLARALAAARGLAASDAELLVHDVLNVFMCTGFTREGHRYFMKASPGASRRFHRVLRRDRPARRALGLPRRRLWRDAFLRRGLLFSAQGGNPAARRRWPGRVATCPPERLCQFRRIGGCPSAVSRRTWHCKPGWPGNPGCCRGKPRLPGHLPRTR